MYGYINRYWRVRYIDWNWEELNRCEMERSQGWNLSTGRRRSSAPMFRLRFDSGGVEQVLREMLGVLAEAANRSSVEQLSRKVRRIQILCLGNGVVNSFVPGLRLGVHSRARWCTIVCIDSSPSYIWHSIWRTRIPRVPTFELLLGSRGNTLDVSGLRVFVAEKAWDDSYTPLDRCQAVKLTLK